jgi:hypothetical protein
VIASKVGRWLLGLTTILASGLMVEGGVREVRAYWGGQETLPVVVGAFGAAASALLVLGGFALLVRAAAARRLALAGAAAMIPVHVVGFLAGLIGLGGALPGIVYPAAILFFLRPRPPAGSREAARRERTPTRSGPADGVRRARLAHASWSRS